MAITADFRKYTCVEDSVADHSAYLLGAKNGRSKRYKGLAGCRDYKKAVQIIKDGGYATDLGYVNKLCNIIERYNLTQYDTGAVTNTTEPAPDTTAHTPLPYLVKVSIPNLNIRKGPGTNYARTGFFTGIGVFTIVDVQSGQGSDTDWGKLKSGAGWISLDYTKKL